MKARPYGLLILVFCLFLFSFGADRLGLEFKGDENFYFESAREMTESGDLVTPRYMGEARFQKPILFYWLTAASFKMFGVNWLAARLPSIIFGALSALLVFTISIMFFEDKSVGLLAAGFLATTPLYYRYARLALPDMALVFFITLALYSFLRFFKDKSSVKSVLTFFAALALAFLVKGPVGIVIPLLIIGIFCLIKKENPFRLSGSIAGIALFFLIIAPWFYLIYKAHGEAYLSHVWIREITQRLGQGCQGYFIIRFVKGLGFYLSALVTKFLPFSLFLPAAFIKSVSTLSKRTGNPPGKRDGHLFLCIWAVIVLLFFTFVAEKRTHYLLVLSPAVSILLGVAFKAALTDEKFFKRALFRIPYLTTLIGLAIFAIVFILSDAIAGGKDVALWRFTLIIVPVILILGLRRKNSILMPASITLSLAILYISMIVSPPLGLFMNKMERAAAMIKSELRQGDRIGVGSHGIIPEELQAFFEVPVENVKVRYGSDGMPNLDTAYPLLSFLDSRERVFCVIKRKDYDNFVSDGRKEDLLVLGSYYVWKRRIRIDKELRDSFDSAVTRSLREIFQNEIYVVSNKE